MACRPAPSPLCRYPDKCERMSALSALCYGCENARRRAVNRDSLTPRQESALQFIARRPGCRMRELADNLESKIAAAFDVADRLRLKGMVERRAVGRHFTVTPRGAAFIAGREGVGGRCAQPDGE